MNTSKLNEKLKGLNIPKDAYSLQGGFPNESFCIGEDNGVWETYYSERGNKTGLKTFTNEKEACEYFLLWMQKTFKK